MIIWFFGARSHFAPLFRISIWLWISYENEYHAGETTPFSNSQFQKSIENKLFFNIIFAWNTLSNAKKKDHSNEWSFEDFGASDHEKWLKHCTFSGLLAYLLVYHAIDSWFAFMYSSAAAWCSLRYFSKTEQYVFKVILISECPRIFCNTLAGIPDSIHLVA